MKQIIIDGIPTDYCITEDGRCWSNKRNKWMKGSIDKYGYHFYQLTIKNKRKHCQAHRLVALHYIPNDNPEEKNQVNHIDGNKLNNNVENLEWVSCKENVIHAVDNNLHRHKQVYKYDDLGNLLNIYNSLIEAAKDNQILSTSGICECCRGKQKHCGGYRWSYEEVIEWA